MHTTIRKTREFSGIISGTMWDGFDGSLSIEAQLHGGSVKDQLAAIARNKGGDFQSRGRVIFGAVIVTRCRATSGPVSSRVIERCRTFSVGEVEA